MVQGLLRRVRPVGYDSRMPDDERIFDATLREALALWRLELSARQFDQLFAHYRAIIETNRSINLTRIIDPTEAAIKHYADSLALLVWISESGYKVGRLLDVGTGAGFPAIPLAILRPAWSVTAIDGTAKKIAFVRRTAEALGLTNLTSEHAHSSHYNPAARFDLVVTRAVGSLETCLAVSAPHAIPRGLVVAYKTPAVIDEMGKTTAVEQRLNLSRLDPHSYELFLHGKPIARLLIPYRRQR